jgi:hypothetical protein
MGGRVSALRQFVVAAVAAYCRYPPNHAPTRELLWTSQDPSLGKSGLRKVRLDETRVLLRQLVLLTRVSLRHIRCWE